MSRGKRGSNKVSSSNLVYLPVEEEFLDSIGNTWRLKSDSEEMDLRDVLTTTVRRCPVKTGGDAERTLDLIRAIRAEDDGFIEMRKDDYDWMIAHFKEMAHNVWNPPDAAYLIYYLKENVTNQASDTV